MVDVIKKKVRIGIADDEPGLQGFRTINCTEEQHPFAGAYWPAGTLLGMNTLSSI